MIFQSQLYLYLPIVDSLKLFTKRKSVFDRQNDEDLLAYSFDIPGRWLKGKWQVLFMYLISVNSL